MMEEAMHLSFRISYVDMGALSIFNKPFLFRFGYPSSVIRPEGCTSSSIRASPISFTQFRLGPMAQTSKLTPDSVGNRIFSTKFSLIFFDWIYSISKMCSRKHLHVNNDGLIRPLDGLRTHVNDSWHWIWPESKGEKN